MRHKQKSYDCSIASKKVRWDAYFEEVGGIGSAEVEFVEMQRACSNEIECSTRGLLADCPMRKD